jgi:hypothetical protein
MQDQDILDKFRGAAEPVLGKDRAAVALQRWWALRDIRDVSEALQLLDVWH